MNTIIRILVLIIVLGCNNSKSENKNQFEHQITDREERSAINECEEGKVQAEKDISKDSLGLYFYGLPKPRFNTWVRLIRTEYDLQMKGGGDIIEVKGACYNEVMHEEIKRKFGKDAFDRIESKVDSLYRIGQGDREPEFTGRDSALMKYIYCGLEEELLSDDEDMTPLIVIQFSIDKEGNIRNPEIMFENESAKSDSKYKNKAIELINRMPKWIPGVENTETKEFRYSLPIKFGIGVKKENCG